YVQAAGDVTFAGAWRNLTSITLSSANGSINTNGHLLDGDVLAATASKGLVLATDVSAVEAQTATGGIRIDNSGGTLHVGSGFNPVIKGVQVTTSGDVRLTNQGSIVLDTDSDDVQTADGDVVIQADGATANVEVGHGSLFAPIATDNG